jgi:putative flippase GtrA
LSLIRDLYSRFSGVGVEGIKFCIVGGAGAVIQISLQDFLHLEAGIDPYTATAIGTLISIILTFFGNRYWTYAAKRSHGRQLIRETWQFTLWACIGWGVQEGVLWVGTSGLHWTSGIAYTLVSAAGIGLATIFRFWAYRTFVFIGEGPRDAAAPTEELGSEMVS